MKRLLLAVLIPLLIGAPWVHAQERPVSEAIVMVGTGCTGFVIRSGLVATASHCVGQPAGSGPVVALVDGVRRQYTGVVVWDSSFQEFPGNTGVVDGDLDFALISVQGLTARTVAFDTRIPTPGTQLLSISIASGIFHWQATLFFVGPFWHREVGDVLIYRGDTYPGASGSPALLNGRAVGIITHGVIDAQPLPILIGAPATRLLVAIKDFDERGPMRFCSVTDSDGKVRREICRGGS